MSNVKKWRVIFYRDKEKTDRYISCFVYGPDAASAIDYCKNYFKLYESNPPITLDVTEVVA